MKKYFLLISMLLMITLTFLGCRDNTTMISTTTLPTSTTTFTSTVDSIPTSILITFYNSGDDQIPSVTLEVGSTLPLPTPERIGFDFMGWYIDDVLIDNNYVFENDTSLVAHWNPQIFTLTYSTGQDDLYCFISQIFIRRFIDQQGHLYTYGLNTYGSLGTGDNDNRMRPVDITANLHMQEDEEIKFIESSDLHTVLVTSLNRVFTWGFNLHGQLGTGDIVNKSVPVDITESIVLEAGEEIIGIEVFYYMSFILTSNHRVIAFGRNADKQLDFSSDPGYDVSTPMDITDNFDLNQGETIDQIRIGGTFISYITSEHRIFIQGRKYYIEMVDDFHQGWTEGPYDLTPNIPLFDGESVVDMVNGINHSLFVTSNNRIIMLGYFDQTYFDEEKTPRFYNFEDLTRYLALSENETIIDIQSAYDTALIRTSKDRIFGFGRNFHGELGVGDQLPREFPIEISSYLPLRQDESIRSISLNPSQINVWTSLNRFLISGENMFGLILYGEESEEPFLFNEFTFFHDIYQSGELELAYEGTITIPLPLIEGYEFGGWYTDAEYTVVFDNLIMPAHNVTLYGLWILNTEIIPE